MNGRVFKQPYSSTPNISSNSYINNRFGNGYNNSNDRYNNRNDRYNNYRPYSNGYNIRYNPYYNPYQYGYPYPYYNLPPYYPPYNPPYNNNNFSGCKYATPNIGSCVSCVRLNGGSDAIAANVCL